MIQRIQTVYLVAACILLIASLFLPIGTITATDGTAAAAYNLCLVQSLTGNTDAGNAPVLAIAVLIVILAVAVFNGAKAIFLYRSRKIQATLCLFGAMLIMGWYVLYAAFAIVGLPNADDIMLHPQWGLVLPFVAGIFLLLARRAINHDEQLVRAADRIR